MAIKRLYLIYLLILFSAGAVFSQQQNPNYKTFIAKIGYTDTLVNLNENFIIQYSDILTLQNIILSPKDDYTVDYRKGQIVLEKNLFSKYNLDTFQVYNLKIDYDVFPYTLKEEYSNFDIITETDTLTGDTVQIATQKKDFIGSLFEGTDLEKSGSIFRGITVGSNQDLTVNSGFRLQLNGKLSSDFEINAALTDESSPIQPEGNTEKLQELDNVFIEIKNPRFTGTIGDINVDIKNTEFMNFKRKIQGAKGFSDYGPGNIFLSGSVQKGKFNTNSFNGQDNNQGPYILVGSDNEINILIISGSEKVFLDGIAMTRGEQADYIIDYGVGSITFTNNRLITSASRIIVDFEYSDRKYSRTNITGANELRLFSGKMKFGVSYVNETDNQDKTIDFSLSEKDREILAQAGDDKYKAVKSGVEYVGRDTATGKGVGLYVKSDTLINKETINYYRYLPGDSNAVYQVVFSFVGQGKGSYIQQSSIQYDFKGPGIGIYDTVIFIPIPNAYQVADVSIDYQSSPKKEFTFNLESAVSVLDGNKLSSINDNDNGGLAFLGTLGLNKYNFRLLGMNLHALEFSLKQKTVNKIFVPLERYNPVEFYRQYDIQDSNKLTEDLREASLKIAPKNYVNISATFGQLLRGSIFNSKRAAGEFSMMNDSLGLPEARYKIEFISTDNSLVTKSSWLRQNAILGYKKYFGGFSFDNTNIEMRAEYIQENRQNKLNVSGTDSLSSGSFSFYEIKPRLILNNFHELNFYTELGYRQDNLPLGGAMLKESNAFTQTYGVGYRGVQWLSTLLEFTLRDKKYTDEFTSDVNTNNKTLLVNWQTRLDPLNSAMQTDLYYNVTSERQSKREKDFVQVPFGEGNYIYLGDLNGNGLKDENEFQLTNYNDGNYVRIFRQSTLLFPVTGLNTSFRINLKPTRFFNVTGSGFMPEVLRNTSAETYFRTEEKSQDPNTDNIYFLHFSTFQNDSNTVFGTQLFQQDINFFEFNPNYSLKLRYIEQKTFNQFVSGNERFFTIQKSVKLKLGLTRDLTTYFEYQNKVDRNDAPSNSVRNRNIKSDGVITDFSYRPVQEIESGFQINFSRATDHYPADPTNADINQQLIRFIYSFTLQGRIRLELERDEVLISNSIINFPYELTNGKVAGKTFVWRVFFDYSISKNLQATLNYDGRVEGGRKAVNTGRAEVKAFF